MATTIPASVSRRKRLILAGDIFLGLAIVAAALHFFALGLSNLLWPIAGIAATMCTTWLRQSIRHLDVPTTEMATAIVLFLVAGATAFGLRFFGAEHVAVEQATSGANIAIFFAKLIYIQLLWIPFAVAKELANKLNADELRSGGN